VRAHEIKQYDSVLQALGEPGCPICVLLKNLQTKLVQEGDITEFLYLCNAHAWAIAAVRKTESATRIFLSLLEHLPDTPRHECSICIRLEQEQILRTQELIAGLERKSVLEWISKQGTVCLPHGVGLRSEAPAPVRKIIDQLLERRTSELKAALRHLLRDLSPESNQHSGLLGRAAEYLVSQRGVSLGWNLNKEQDCKS